jgi:hypothetical protein
MASRAIEIQGPGLILRLSKITSIKVIGKNFLHLDELEDATWRLTYNSLHIKDLSQVDTIAFQNGTLRIDGIDAADSISLVPIKTSVGMVHLDQAKDGRWKLLYNAERFPGLKDATGLRIKREQDEGA